MGFKNSAKFDFGVRFSHPLLKAAEIRRFFCIQISNKHKNKGAQTFRTPLLIYSMTTSYYNTLTFFQLSAL